MRRACQEDSDAAFWKKNKPFNLEYLVSVEVHAVVRLDPFPTKIDSSTGPMRIVVIDGNQNDIF